MPKPRSQRARSSASGPIGGYAAVLALLVLGRDAEAEPIAARIEEEGLDPAAVARALDALARADAAAYAEARRAVLASFESRDAFLEDVPVADTVLVLDALAVERGIGTAPLSSGLLPAEAALSPRRLPARARAPSPPGSRSGRRRGRRRTRARESRRSSFLRAR